MTQKINFGFATINFEDLYVIHTGKIRIARVEMLDVEIALQSVISYIRLETTHKGYILITWVTTDLATHQRIIKAVSRLMHATCIARVNMKYHQHLIDDSDLTF